MVVCKDIQYLGLHTVMKAPGIPPPPPPIHNFVSSPPSKTLFETLIMFVTMCSHTHTHTDLLPWVPHSSYSDQLRVGVPAAGRRHQEGGAQSVSSFISTLFFLSFQVTKSMSIILLL